MRKPTHDYIGRKPCGCVVAVTCDMNDNHTRREVVQWMHQGLAIERVALEYVKEHIDTWFDCQHEVVQLELAL